MSDKKNPPRSDPKGGFCNPKKLPKGPNGRALCRNCQQEVPTDRRSFCSEACVDDWSIRTSPGAARKLVIARDKGVCAVCGFDTTVIDRDLWALLREGQRRYEAGEILWAPFGVRRYGKLLREAVDDMFRRYGLEPRAVDHRKSFFDVDHVVPVAEGGGSCGLSNLRTLCLPHHKDATADLKRRLAQRKKDAPLA